MNYAVILAAGKGSRMKSHTIKVLHPILGKPMVQWSIDVAKQAQLQPILVVGHQQDKVRDALKNEHVEYAVQEVPRGTGHAVMCALPYLPKQGHVVVFFGDTPLFRSETLQSVLQWHIAHDRYATFVSAVLADAGSYGRIVRAPNNDAIKIVEAANASPEELQIQEINTGAAVFNLEWLHTVLPNFVEHPPKAEIYLTDALEKAAEISKAGAFVLKDSTEANGVNDRLDLHTATKILQQRIIAKHLENGVGFADIDSVTIEDSVRIGQDCWVDRGVVLRGNTKIGNDVHIDAYSILDNTQVDDCATIEAYTHCANTIIHSHASVGPFARLRENTTIGISAKVGNFVEMKKTTLATGAKASHLTYLGDSVVGEKANIGAGTITCNYDGFRKHQTHIAAGAFIGSNSALVAPVQIGEGAIVGAGSVITKNVEANSIAVTRSEQVSIADGAVRFRNKQTVIKK